MGLKRDVVISIYYILNGLTFDIRYIILRNVLNRKWSLQNLKEISSEFTEKLPKIMRSWLI